MKFRVLFCTIAASVLIAAEVPAVAPEAIVENYCTAIRSQDKLIQGATMDVEIAAALPKLKKQGKLHALRRIGTLGRITYEKLRFDGDTTVKSQVINRYLTAEAEAQEDSSRASVAVTPANYTFKYKGRTNADGRDIHIFQVTPKKKRQGLFKGEVWIDATTYLLVQESGYLVKSPSIFLKKIEFVRKYDIRDGISVPVEESSVVDTRLGVGRAELTIEFTNFAVDGKKTAGQPEIQ